MAGPAPRERILDAVIRLLAEGGRAAVSTRAVGEAAGVQAPTLYRLFGDKQGLLDAAAARGITEYLNRKRTLPRPDDPVESFREGWDQQVELALENPALYLLMQERWRTLDPAESGVDLLRGRIEGIARAGRLRMDLVRAVLLVHAVGGGVATALIALPPEQRDLGMSVVAREAMIGAITTGEAASASAGPIAATVALKAHLPLTGVLSDPESALLGEWLDRIARSDAASF